MGMDGDDGVIVWSLRVFELIQMPRLDITMLPQPPPSASPLKTSEKQGENMEERTFEWMIFSLVIYVNNRRSYYRGGNPKRNVVLEW